MWWLFAGAMADPVDFDELEAWQERLTEAIRGPKGCFVALGSAEWAHRLQGQVSQGRAAFRVRFDERTFDDFRFLDPELEVAGPQQDRDLTLQFRPWLGGRRSGWLLIASSEGLFIRDRTDDDPDHWVPTANDAFWVEPLPMGGRVVHHEFALKGRANGPKERRVGFVPPGANRIQEIRFERDLHAQRNLLTLHRHEGVLRYGPDGRPAFEERTVRWYRAGIPVGRYFHRITYASFVPCEAPLPPIAKEQRVMVSPRSSVALPYTEVVLDPRAGRIEILRFEARELRQAAWLRISADLTLIGLTLGLTARERRRAEDPTRVGTIAAWTVAGLTSAALTVDLGFASAKARRGNQRAREARALELARPSGSADR